MSASEPPRPKVPTGIAGLDQMLRGGLPSGHVVLVTGLPGTGKTCFALQFLMAGVARGETGVFLSLEEDVPQLLESGRQFGWPVDEAVQRKSLNVIRLDPRETKQSIQRIRGEFAGELAKMKAQRIVVDSVSLLHMLSDTETSRRETLFALAGACRASGATTVFTAEADPLHPGVSRDGLSEYVADGVILLGYSTPSEGRRIDLALRILKMRRTDHARSIQPYWIRADGIEVDAQAIDFSRGG